MAKRYDGVRKTKLVVEAFQAAMTAAVVMTAVIAAAAVTAGVIEAAAAVTAAEVERDEVVMEVVQCRTKLTFVEQC